MGEVIGQVVVAGVAMAIIDGLWLVFIARTFYAGQVGHLLRQKPNMIAAVIFYVLYIIGVVVFVVHPAARAASWQYALGYGALFGLVAYGTYDLTNLSTLKGFTTKLAIIDMLWGMCLTATIAVISFWIVR